MRNMQSKLRATGTQKMSGPALLAMFCAFTLELNFLKNMKCTRSAAHFTVSTGYPPRTSGE